MGSVRSPTLAELQSERIRPRYRRNVMLRKFAIGSALVIGVTATLVGGASAVQDSKTTVTIKAEGTDLSGTVRSPNLHVCAHGRKVLVIKQKGARGGGDDIRFASDTAELVGNIGRWSTGTTGTPGRFYAKVKPIPGCKGDTSKTVRATRTM
jgi:hypothetical protein